MSGGEVSGSAEAAMQGLDIDIESTDIAKKNIAQAAEIAAAENISEFEDDYLQDDIPVDDGDDEEGIISDHYEQFDDLKKK